MSEDKGSKRKEMEAVLGSALVKDKESAVKIRQHMNAMCDICTKGNVEPETLLLEISILRNLTEEILREKMVASAGMDADKMSRKAEKKLKKRFQRMCEVIEAGGQGAVTEIKKNALGKTAVQGKGPQVPNEMQPYIPTKDRPDYIF